MFILGEANNNYIICTLHLFLVKVYGTANKNEFNIQINHLTRYILVKQNSLCPKYKDLPIPCNIYNVHMWLVLGKSLKYESSLALSVCESIIQKAKGREERGLRKYLHS